MNCSNLYCPHNLGRFRIDSGLLLSCVVFENLTTRLKKICSFTIWNFTWLITKYDIEHVFAKETTNTQFKKRDFLKMYTAYR